jgi:ribose 5-phosphate isomerase B
MRIAVGADHAGFELKKTVVQVLRDQGHEVLDLGAFTPEPSDYPIYAKSVGNAVRNGEADRGILLCGSGVGVSIAASKLRGIRAGLCHDAYSAHQCVEHDNVNVLCMGPRVIGTELALDLIQIFLNARFTGEERHVRRLAEVQEIEEAENVCGSHAQSAA